MHHPFVDRLIERAQERDSRVIVGLDPNLEVFPHFLQERLRLEPTEANLEEILFDFNVAVIEASAASAVGFKPQAAFYEQYGLAGMKALYRTLTRLREMGELIILDAKRNDVSHTAEAYATAWLGARHPVFGTPNPWQADALTINGYLGADGIRPFLNVNPEAGLFVLAKTSNPSSGELQDLLLQDGFRVAEKMAQLAAAWGETAMGACGYANIGIVVGATYPEQAARLRQLAPHAPFLMPGIGAQGGSLQAVVAASGADQLGAYAASSRGVMYPFAPAALSGPEWRDAAHQAISRAAGELRLAIRQVLASKTR
ncbi:MAG: orotidine-5'-phosphate decarboxylase [Magnetococcales bacterium]|nr:orotidine-5'-phosphate decarboxylase [Magnetococcales bacterium]